MLDSPPSSFFFFSPYYLRDFFRFQCVCVCVLGVNNERKKSGLLLLFYFVYRLCLQVHSKPILGIMLSHTLTNQLPRFSLSFFLLWWPAKLLVGPPWLASNLFAKQFLGLNQILSKLVSLSFDFLNYLVSLIKHRFSLNHLINTNLNLVT